MSSAAPPPGAAKPIALRMRFASTDDFVRTHLATETLAGLIIPGNTSVPIGLILDLVLELGEGRGIRTLARVEKLQSNANGTTSLHVRFTEMQDAHRNWLASAIKIYLEKNPTPVSPDAPREQMLRKAIAAKDLAGSNENLTPLAISGNEPVLGIDLGTSNSCACIVRGEKNTFIDMSEATLNQQGVTTLPSIVAYDDSGSVTVGARAQEGLRKNLKRTIYGAKRFIGRSYDSPTVQSMLSRFPYKVVPGPEGKVAVDINGRPVALTAISAKILTAIRERADKQLGVPIRRAIITVPAYYNDNQRDAVVQAGRIAGLTVERIVNEPTAAAIAYGLTRSKPRRLIVYDLGGGTFDVSVMSVQHDSLLVMATAGDTFLGGEDFDAAIVQFVCENYAKRSKKQLSQNSGALALIKEAAEKAKRRLTVADKVMITVRDAMLVDGSSVRVEQELTRAELEKMVEPLVSRSLKICEMALREARIENEQLGDVILVGGQTRMPYVQQRVRDYFKMAPRCDLNPDEVVALGAALLAQLPANESAKLQDVLSMSIGVSVAGRFKPLLLRNSPVPCSKSMSISVAKDKWANYELEVFQGDAAELHQNELLGKLRVDSVAPGDVDPVPVRIDFMLTNDCLLKVVVTNTRTEQSQQVLLSTRDSA